MSFMRLVLFFILFYAVYYIIKLFIINFRIGARKKDKFQTENRQNSKYENVEEAEFTEIESKEKNDKK